MIRELTDEIIHDINAILTAATILQETIDKRSPNIIRDKAGIEEIIPDHDLHVVVAKAIHRLTGLTKLYSYDFCDDV